MVKQSQPTPVQVLNDLPPLDFGPTMKEVHHRCKVVRVTTGTWPSWDDVHRLVVHHHYLHAWSAHTLMFAVVVDNFHIAAVAVFGVGGRLLPESLRDGWTWVDANRNGQVLELQRMFAQPWAAKGMVSWFLRRCRMEIRQYYPRLKAIVVYVDPFARDRWTGEPKGHTGKTYARHCRAKRLPDTKPRTEYSLDGIAVHGRQVSKLTTDEHEHIAGGKKVGEPIPELMTRTKTGAKHRFIWFQNCDPRHLKLKKPIIDEPTEEAWEEEIISFDHMPTEEELERASQPKRGKGGW